MYFADKIANEKGVNKIKTAIVNSVLERTVI